MMPKEGKEELTLDFFKTALLYFIITLLLGVLLITGKTAGLFEFAGARAAHLHAGLLGFITLTIMGAMYQITPTLVGTTLYSERLARKQYVVMTAGVTGLFLTLLLSDPPLTKPLTILFGALILIASFLFAYIIFQTAANSKSKIKPITLSFFKIAVIYYLIGSIMGFLSAIYPDYFEKILLSKTAHAHLGTLGFITMTIYGAEYQMFPMLSLQKLHSEKWARINLWTLTLGVSGFFIGLLALNKWVLALFVGLLLASIYIFVGNMLLTLKGASLRKLDISVRYMIAGHGFLLFTTFIGGAMGVLYHFGLIDFLVSVGLASEGFGLNRLIWTHAHLALIGFAILTIMGAMYHLVPMIVWMSRYGPKMGKEKVPNIQDLFSQNTANIILITLVSGLIILLYSSLYNKGTSLIFSTYLIGITGSLFALEMYRIIKIQPSS